MPFSCTNSFLSFSQFENWLGAFIEGIMLSKIRVGKIFWKSKNQRLLGVEVRGARNLKIRWSHIIYIYEGVIFMNEQLEGLVWVFTGRGGGAGSNPCAPWAAPSFAFSRVFLFYLLLVEYYFQTGSVFWWLAFMFAWEGTRVRYPASPFSPLSNIF